MTPQNKLEDDYYLKSYRKQKIKLYDIKHFIFDFGGVMVEKTFILKNLFEILEDDFKIKIPDKESSPFIKKIRRQATSGIISSREFLQKIFQKYYNPPEIQNAALPAKKPNIDYYLEITNFSSELEEIIVRLHQAGYKISLMSNTYDIHARSNLLNGFYKIFDHVFLSNEIGILKPDLEKYKYMLNKLETKPKKCVFIDDKIRNLAPAQTLGMTIIKFESIEKFKKLLAEFKIDDISKNTRKEIRKKYKQYKMKKKEYTNAKKAYKETKKDFLYKNTISQKRKLNYQLKHADYIAKKLEYKEERKKKKDELMAKIKINE